MKRALCIVALFPLILFSLSPLSNTQIQKYKADPKGPFQYIRWFCPDGRVLLPSESCQQKGAIQHAVHKPDVIQLQSKHIFLGSILAGTDKAAFLDEKNRFSRAKQYQLERYLFEIDDGWILRKAQFYRGAYQIEDEIEWSGTFLDWLLSQETVLNQHFLFVRQLFNDLPKKNNENALEKMRTLSTKMANLEPEFQPIRSKIHSQPDKSDSQKVRQYREAFEHTSLARETLLELEKVIDDVYRKINMADIDALIKSLPPSELKDSLQKLSQSWWQLTVPQKAAKSADILLTLKQEIVQNTEKEYRVLLMKLSVSFEQYLNQLVLQWPTLTLGDAIEKVRIYKKAMAGCGYLEAWEYDAAMDIPLSDTSISAEDMANLLQNSSLWVEWGVGQINAIYGPTVTLFSAFEPLSTSFIDHKVRSSVLFHMGQTVAQLSEFWSKETGLVHEIPFLETQPAIRGINPGFAAAPLQVIFPESDGHVDIDSNSIVVVSKLPEDLKPVRGILVADEGNPVSHVQLLAKNLGIPNTVIQQDHLRQLQAHNGKKVWYAVSPKGRVILKPVEAMTESEQKLSQKKAHRTMAVPLKKLRLDRTELIPLGSLNAKMSGQFCGPKAANLGQLKQLFPDKVTEGFVIPFGVYKAHMMQKMPGQDTTYWDYLTQIFKEKKHALEQGQTDLDVEKVVLAKLAILHKAITDMPFLPGFEKKLETAFITQLKAPLGDKAVFVRSDTNMEDLKEFTGAGLNLTVGNVKNRGAILQAIKDVWASPFKERSYRWRQLYLTNPEHVYPSILVMESDRVEKSGVLITKNIWNGDEGSFSLSMNRGVGGAVEGQSAESWELNIDYAKLKAPSRAVTYNDLAEQGGFDKKNTSYAMPVLSIEERLKIDAFIREILPRLPRASYLGYPGPYDIELGMKNGNIRLFQIRPFVETTMGFYTDYMTSLDKGIGIKKETLLLSTPL